MRDASTDGRAAGSGNGEGADAGGSHLQAMLRRLRALGGAHPPAHCTPVTPSGLGHHATGHLGEARPLHSHPSRASTARRARD
jgi:hypothetical protein